MLIGRARAVALPESVLAQKPLALCVTFTGERVLLATRFSQLAQTGATDGRVDWPVAAAAAHRFRRFPGAAAAAFRFRWRPRAASSSEGGSAVLSALSCRARAAAAPEISILIPAAQDRNHCEYTRDDPKLHARLLTRRGGGGNGAVAIVVIIEF
jgi:hypothetical protein